MYVYKEQNSAISANWKKLMLIQDGTKLLLMLTKPHTMTLISSNRSIFVNGSVVCRSLIFLILPKTCST